MAATSTDVVAGAVTAAACTITAAGSKLKVPFVESDLQKVLAAELVASLATQALELIVKPNCGVKLVEWPGVGPVDMSLLDGDGRPAAFLELKWGSGTLYNCVWDVAKMAVAIARWHARHAYLVAGAPTAEWRRSEGSELFGTGTWETADLLSVYAHHWKFWRADVKTHPASLPTTITSRAVNAAPVTVRGDEWEIRCVEIFADDAEWLLVVDAATGERASGASACA